MGGFQGGGHWKGMKLSRGGYVTSAATPFSLGGDTLSSRHVFSDGLNFQYPTRNLVLTLFVLCVTQFQKNSQQLGQTQLLAPGSICYVGCVKCEMWCKMWKESFSRTKGFVICVICKLILWFLICDFLCVLCDIWYLMIFVWFVICDVRYVICDVKCVVCDM